MSRVYNFSAGPSCLPEEVLNECAAEMLDYKGTGQSVAAVGLSAASASLRYFCKQKHTLRVRCNP